MPSQIAHLLLAEDVVADTRPDLRSRHPDTAAALVLGAQGPDLFLHNRRRKPSGLHYGIVLHRKGSGTFCASFLDYTMSLSRSGTEPAIIQCLHAYLIGYLTHVVLDRTLHPYINVHAGWREPGNPDTYGYHANHVFLERIIDTYLADKLRSSHPRFMQIHRMMHVSETVRRPLLHALKYSVARSTRRGAQDTRLLRKLMNAYNDAASYYAAIHEPDLHDARRRIRRSPTGSPVWLRYFHPLSLPDDLDPANETHRPWRDPCSGLTVSTDSVLDRYGLARKTAADLVSYLYEAERGNAPVYSASYRNTPFPGDPLPEHTDPGEGFEGRVGNGDLSDERPEGEQCRRIYMDVMDFKEVLQHAARAIIDAD